MRWEGPRLALLFFGGLGLLGLLVLGAVAGNTLVSGICLIGLGVLIVAAAPTVADDLSKSDPLLLASPKLGLAWGIFIGVIVAGAGLKLVLSG